MEAHICHHTGQRFCHILNTMYHSGLPILKTELGEEKDRKEILSMGIE